MMMEDDDSNPDGNTSEKIHSLMMDANQSRHGINMTKSDTPQDNDKAPLSIVSKHILFKIYSLVSPFDDICL